MKNYELQVKEIPIIFRGILPAAPSIEPFEKTITGSAYNLDDIHTVFELQKTISLDPFPDLSQLTLVSIRFKFGEDSERIYTNAPKYHNTNNDSYYWGSQLNEANMTFDDDNYPFKLTFTPFDPSLVIALDVDYSGSALNPSTSLEIIGQIGEGEEGQNLIKMACDLTGNGQINHFRARFACGENGTLHLRPYVILNGNIRIDLCNFAHGGDQYIAGDNEEIEFDCYVPIETHAVAYVEAENTGEYPSLVDAAMTVQYEDFIESESIVGYEGVNLRRGRR